MRIGKPTGYSELPVRPLPRDVPDLFKRAAPPRRQGGFICAPA